jgi:putative transposase
MQHARHRLLYHFVWTTWNKLPLLEGQVGDRAHAAIRRRCGEMEITVNAVGGTADHVHLLATLPPGMCVEDFLRSVKEASSRAIQRTFGSSVTAFRWQLGFGVYTVSPCHRSKVRDYIMSQKELHVSGEIWKGCEPKPGVAEA